MIQTPLLPDAVQWSEGMLLSPQHFQQNDIYWHAQLRHKIQILSPNYWGVTKLDFSLANDTVSISGLECILPDGLAIQFPGNTPRQPSGNLEKQVTDDDCKINGPALCVWLWVRDRLPNAAVQSNNERRYDSIGGQQIADENTGDGQINIERLQTRFELHFGATSPSLECAVPLFKIERGDNGQLTVNKYHPPMLRLDASDFQESNSLHNQLQQLHDLLWNKTRQLAGNVDDAAPEQEYGLTAESRQHLFAARQIASCLPQLSINLYPECPPSQMYQAVAEVVSRVANFGANPLPLQMKPYNHDDCMPQFQAAFAYITAKLKLVETTFELLRFAKLDNTESSMPYVCFARRLLSKMNNDLVIELIPKSGQTKAHLLDWIKQSKIASETLMPQLMVGRLPGAQVRALDPEEMRQYKKPSESALFLIQNHDDSADAKARLPFFSAEQSLLIQGQIKGAPEAIILYHNKSDRKFGNLGKVNTRSDPHHGQSIEH